MPSGIDTVELSTPRLRLRRYLEGDRSRFIAQMSDVDANRYVSGGAMEASEAAALFQRVFEVYQEHRFAVWAVQMQASKEYVGHAELKPRSGEPGLELIYLLEPMAWGHGLGTELAQALRDHAIHTLDSPQVLATIHPENAASRRVLIKLGFRFAREWMEPDDDVVTCLWAFDTRC